MTEKEREILKRFGDTLRRIRQEKSLSLRQLEALCQVDHNKISMMERAMINPTLVTIAALAKGLGVEVRELVEEV